MIPRLGTLDKITAALNKVPGRVDSATDDQPIKSLQFHDNDGSPQPSALSRLCSAASITAS